MLLLSFQVIEVRGLSIGNKRSDVLAEANQPSVLHPRVFIGGLGYCGSRLAERLRQEFSENVHIVGTVRSQERRQRSAALNQWVDSVHVLDMDNEYLGLDAKGKEDLIQATHILQTIAPIADHNRDPLLALHGELIQSATSLRWIGYLSSTGVYGDHGGDWVDENSPLLCIDVKSRARVEAENEWRELATSLGSPRVDILRCGGIYGPGRGPLFSNSDDLTVPIESNSTPKYVNRVLVDDICGAVVAAIRTNGAKPATDSGGVGVYNVVDDDPAPRREVVMYARHLRGLDEIQNSGQGRKAVSKDLSPPLQRRPTSRNTGNKRCINTRLKKDYDWQLKAPTFREGLKLLFDKSTA